MEHADSCATTWSKQTGTNMAAGLGLQSDATHPTGGANNGGANPEVKAAVGTRVPTAKYTKVGERLRHVIPGHMQCSMTCGGRACKYENPSRWSEQEQAIKGLYSSWITDNLLAMARPSTEIIEKYNIIEQFQRCGIRTVINLQRPGEHASCGSPLEQDSGFTYRPEVFMEAGIYFYNFGWKDYGVASLTTILDMVKVMSFAIQEGKMAVHCHAGLGRTGVLLACYLVFTTRMSANQAIVFVRAKRPNSIQTRGQLLCVREFAQFLAPLRNVFSCVEPRASPVTLSQYLTRQRHLLHGYEARQLKNMPKIVHLVCKVLLDIAENRQVTEEVVLELPDLAAEVEKTVSQQAIQQLGKELIGKGITPACLSRPAALAKLPSVPVHSMSVPGDHDLWVRHNADWARPPCHLHKMHSYSDSELHRLRSMLSWEEMPHTVLTSRPFHGSPGRLRLSHNDLVEVSDLAEPSPSQAAGIEGDVSQAWEPRRRAEADESSPLVLRRRPLSAGQRSMSLGSSDRSRPSSAKGAGPEGHADQHTDSSWTPCAAKAWPVSGGVDDGDSSSEVPLVTVQTELTVEARHVLVAQALAFHLEQGGRELRSKVLKWQSELNSKEGAWERLCLERDPFVLSSLMWSWLEQLKEPMISRQDMCTLSAHDAQTAVHCLDKSTRETLLCVLGCVARLLAIPVELEDALLHRAIKAFTKETDADSDEGKVAYESLRNILVPVLHETRLKAAKEAEPPCYCVQVP